MGIDAVHTYAGTSQASDQAKRSLAASRDQGYNGA
jgi:hypothetical protein